MRAAKPSIADVSREGYRERLDIFLASRDAARHLTSDALREDVTPNAAVSAATQVESLADKAVEIVRDAYAPALQCRKGCSHCCQKPGVLISIPELLRILECICDTTDASQLSSLRERCEQYVRSVRGRNVNASWRESIPCPLLVDGLCSVYAVRPLVCRGYNSLSADACARAHRDPAVLVPIFAPLKDATDGATVGMLQRLAEFGVSDAMVDLGTALSIALEPHVVPGSLLRGAVLSTAERNGWAAELWDLVSAAAFELGVPV